MYRSGDVEVHRKLLELDVDVYRRMGLCVGLLETRHGRRVSESEFIRLAIEKACDAVEAI